MGAVRDEVYTGDADDEVSAAPRTICSCRKRLRLEISISRIRPLSNIDSGFPRNRRRHKQPNTLDLKQWMANQLSTLILDIDDEARNIYIYIQIERASLSACTRVHLRRTCSCGWACTRARACVRVSRACSCMRARARTHTHTHTLTRTHAHSRIHTRARARAHTRARRIVHGRTHTHIRT